MITFSNRHDIQSHLASLTTQGVIVELGCGYGNGVIALSGGNINKLPIYSIDPYLPYTDLLGGKYDQETQTAMQQNTAGIKFKHIQASALEAVRNWHKDIGLLWIDLSMDYNNLWTIVHVWEKWLLPGGYLAITGLEYLKLGTLQMYNELSLSGYEPILEQRLVAVLRKL